VKSPAIGVALVAVLCLPTGIRSQTKAPESGAQLFDRIRDGLVHVGQAAGESGSTLDHWLGSGFLVDGSCTVATAKHLFDLADPRRILVRYQTPKDRATVQTVVAVLIGESADRDLAYLRLTTPDGGPCANELRPLPLSPRFDARTLAGESVLIAGFPRLGPYDVDIPVVRRGIVASAEGTDDAKKPMLLLDLTGVSGFSGSPVVLERTGEVIGVVYGPGLIERFADFEIATPIDRTNLDAAKRTTGSSSP
jgi:hypothetical protein